MSDTAPVPIPVPIPVLVNRSGGIAASRGDGLGAEIEAAFAAAGLAIELQLLDGCDMAAAAAGLADRPLVVAGGGDGSLGCVIQALLEGVGKGHAPALGILALGTRNHLARELGVPLDLPGAAKLIAARTTRRIDVARVNGHLFINNASVGLYPALVREREDKQARGLPKWLASVPATAAALQRMKHHRLRLSSPDQEHEVVTPMLFVGNNRYELDAGKLGQRVALDDGKLSVFAVASRRRLALFGFVLRTLTGRADPEQDFAAIGEVAELTVTGRSHRIDIALDGEVRELRMPLDFTIDAGALTVIAPPARSGRLE